MRRMIFPPKGSPSYFRASRLLIYGAIEVADARE